MEVVKYSKDKYLYEFSETQLRVFNWKVAKTYQWLDVRDYFADKEGFLHIIFKCGYTVSFHYEHDSKAYDASILCLINYLPPANQKRKKSVFSGFFSRYNYSDKKTGKKVIQLIRKTLTVTFFLVIVFAYILMPVFIVVLLDVLTPSSITTNYGLLFGAVIFTVLLGSIPWYLRFPSFLKNTFSNVRVAITHQSNNVLLDIKPLVLNKFHFQQTSFPIQNIFPPTIETHYIKGGRHCDPYIVRMKVCRISFRVFGQDGTFELELDPNDLFTICHSIQEYAERVTDITVSKPPILTPNN
ncbi:hypothetical protein [Zooshikella harenae]|uniref:DUF3137 domain-containing protein n=1 Tax=Zooshikella harenae TaxID=2827238 RepID=A0ABS5Z730_9GAMM|nr:hypothetical protein [Zooshikella harenae]MBU2709854.1 hypothetical protein [Zooshikella harenae]